MNQCAGTAGRKSQVPILLGALVLVLWSCSTREPAEVAGPIERPIPLFSQGADVRCVVNFVYSFTPQLFSSCPWSATIDRALPLPSNIYGTGAWEVVFDHPMDTVVAQFTNVLPLSESGGNVIHPAGVLTAYNASGGIVGSKEAVFSDQSCTSPASDCLPQISGPIGQIARVRFETPNRVDLRQLGGIAWTPPPLSVQCTPTSVTRGGTTACEASTAVQGAILAVQGWDFVSDSGGFTVVRGTDTSSTSWNGPIVLPGTVTVTATVGGTPFTATAHVSVSRRDWSSLGSAKTHTVPNPIMSILTSRPTADSLLGRTLATGTLPGFGGGAYVVVDSGPNSAFLYLSRFPDSTRTDANANTIALNDTSSFYRIQERRDKKIAGKTYCAQSRVTSFTPLVIAHEGAVLPSPDVYPNSHSAIYRRHVDSVGRIRYEAFAGPAGVSLQAMFDGIHLGAQAGSKAMDTSQTRNNIVIPTTWPCYWHFTYP